MRTEEKQYHLCSTAPPKAKLFKTATYNSSKSS